MKNDKSPDGNYEVQIKNDLFEIKGITHLGCLALTCVAYDSDIRKPCVVIEKRGLVRCIIFESKYTPWFAIRFIVKGFKYLIFPRKANYLLINEAISA